MTREFHCLGQACSVVALASWKVASRGRMLLLAATSARSELPRPGAGVALEDKSGAALTWILFPFHRDPLTVARRRDTVTG